MTLTAAAEKAKAKTTAELQSLFGHNNRHFVAGKTYKTRCGNKEVELAHVGPITLRGIMRYRYEGRVLGSPYTFYPDGRWLPSLESGNDLMEECEPTL